MTYSSTYQFHDLYANKFWPFSRLQCLISRRLCFCQFCQFVCDFKYTKSHEEILMNDKDKDQLIRFWVKSRSLPGSKNLFKNSMSLSCVFIYFLHCCIYLHIHVFFAAAWCADSSLAPFMTEESIWLLMNPGTCDWMPDHVCSLSHWVLISLSVPGLLLIIQQPQ